MNNLNNIIIEGVLTGLNSFVGSPDGKKELTFGIGVEKNIKNENDEVTIQTSYFDVKVYGNLAEFILTKIKSGQGIRIVGRLEQESIIISDDKVANYVYILGEHIEFRR